MFFNWCCVLNFDEFEEILKGFVLFLELLFKFFVLLLEPGELEGMGAVGDVERLNGVLAAVGGGFTAFFARKEKIPMLRPEIFPLLLQPQA